MFPATHREQLVGLLSEAAEIEHCLMCTYLYAAFSLKADAEEGLSGEELGATRRWKAEIIRIATDEMLHLVLVNNLLIAIGAPPHYRRFNFPISAGLFPADVAVALAPLTLATLDHFVYLERPLAAAEIDAAPIEKVQYERRPQAGRLSTFADDYRTVGELYETIAESFALRVKQEGEANVFIGPSSLQLTAREFRLVGLHAVKNLADVQSAIHLIQHQGEGSRTDSSGSHYARFCAMRREWRALSEKNPAFEPARHVASNPVMRSPIFAERVQIVAEPAASLLDVANAGYGLMLHLLALLSDPAASAAGLRKTISDQSVALMHLTADLGSQLTRLPANAAHPGITAGITFTMSRDSLGFASLATAAKVLADRYARVADRLIELGAQQPLLTRYANGLQGFAAFWAGFVESAPSVSTATATPVRQTGVSVSVHAEPTATTVPTGGVEIATGKAVTLLFEARRCIHSRHCVLDEPRVFIANQPGEWIYPDAVSAERAAQVARNCPSGAIRYQRHDGGESEGAPEVNTVRVRENGPLAVHADLRLDGAIPQHRATLCRCGLSNNKPYCDGSHTGGGFSASGEPPTRESDPLPARGGPLQITPLSNGPLEVSGALELCAGTGRTIDRVSSVRLCRCGQSGNKPYCDGSHAIAGFVASGA